MHCIMTRPQHELWGWETFFDNLKSFIEDTDRHLGNCTESYASYPYKNTSKENAFNRPI